MMILSILLKSYALVLWTISWPVAVGGWILSTLLDIYWLRGRTQSSSNPSTNAAKELLQLQTGALIIGIAVRAVYFEATLRWKSGFPIADRIIEWLFALLKFPTGAFHGRLYAGTMVGPTSYPVNLDTLGLLLPLLFCATACVYLLYYASRCRTVIRGLVWLITALVPIVLLRWVLATGLFLALCDFVNYETQDLPITPFFKPVAIAVLYLPFMAIAAVILHRPLVECMEPDPATARNDQQRLLWLWIPLILLMLLIFWEPKGEQKNGTVLINTYHTDWSKTDRPYDREWYGAASGYNYACLKRLYEGFFDVKELTGRITAEELGTASVLIIFDPNRSFTDEEIQAVQTFIARGGGLFVIGDHTNIFGSSSHLNQIVDGMGFLFRDDVLFDLEEDFFQLKDVPPLHPGILHGMTFFKFRGAASIKPTSIFTRNIITLGNAKSLRAIYSVNNFYPPPHDHPKMWTGDFAVSVASRYGRGRIVGFADSTVFSNFEIFYPGKYEYLLNTVHWLNHANPPLTLPLKRMGLLGVVILAGVLLFRTRYPRQMLGTIAAICLAAMLTWMTARLIEQARADFPEPVRPMRFLFFAAEPEDEALTLRAFVTKTPYEKKYDVFIQWVLRADIFSGFQLYGDRFDNAIANMVRDSDQVDTGLALIATRPDHLVLLDALAPGPVTEEQQLLLMFSRSFIWEDIRRSLSEFLSPDGLAAAEAAWPDGTARIEEGTRRIAIVFQAERFSDRQMGFSEKVTPSEIQKALYAEEFSLLDWLFEAPQP
jgi:hypothetical protein